MNTYNNWSNHFPVGMLRLVINKHTTVDIKKDLKIHTVVYKISQLRWPPPQGMRNKTSFRVILQIMKSTCRIMKTFLWCTVYLRTLISARRHFAEKACLKGITDFAKRRTLLGRRKIINLFRTHNFPCCEVGKQGFEQRLYACQV